MSDRQDTPQGDAEERLPFYKITSEVMADPNLSATAKLLFARLLTSIDLNGKSGRPTRPSHKRLAADVGLKSVSQVKEGLNKLQERGLLDWDNSRGTNYYFLKGSRKTGHLPNDEVAGKPATKDTKVAGKPTIPQPENRLSPSRKTGYQLAGKPATEKNIGKTIGKIPDPSIHQPNVCSETANGPDEHGQIDGPMDGPMEAPVPFPTKPKTESRFPVGYVQMVQDEFRRTRGQVLSGSEVRKFLDVFLDVDEANAYFQNRWPSVGHRTLRGTAGYVADAKAWVKAFREDLADGGGWVYGLPGDTGTTPDENPVDEYPSLSTPEAEATPIPESTPPKNQPTPPLCDTDPSWQRWRDAAAAGNLKAQLVMEAARADGSEAAHQLAVGQYRLEGGMLLVFGDVPLRLVERAARRLDGIHFNSVEHVEAEHAA